MAARADIQAILTGWHTAAKLTRLPSLKPVSEPSPVERAVAAYHAADHYEKPLAAMKLAKAMRGPEESEVPGWVQRMREDRDA